MVWFILSILDWKYLFRANVVQKIKIVSLKTEIRYIDSMEYAEFNGCVHFFSFRPEISFWANLVKKIKIVSLS